MCHGLRGKHGSCALPLAFKANAAFCYRCAGEDKKNKITYKPLKDLYELATIKMKAFENITT